MSRPLRFCLLLLCLSLGTAVALPAALAPGSRLSELPVGATVYRDIEVRSVNARSVVFRHAGGLASIRLRDLSPEWQQRFHYDPAADPPEPASPPPPALAPPPARAKPARPSPSAFEAVLAQFGQPALARAEVDLRPKFFQLELSVKDQGRRPSCAVFAVVSALEFQNAELTGRAAKFSEEYLSWAVRKTVQRLPTAAPANSEPTAGEDRDAGFTLAEVVAALRAYGIPLQARMPNTFGQGIAAILDPTPDIVAEARAHQRVSVHLVPGRDNTTRINNVLHALNAGLPVAIGMAWPHYRTLRNAYLDAQKPLADGGHAVTLVGYRTGTGRLEDAVFIFKNSWGATWGQGGYGIVTYRYLQNHLHDAVLLELHAAAR